METVAITLHINKQQHEFLQLVQQEIKKSQGRKAPLSELLYSFAQIGLRFAQNPDVFMQNLKQNEQNLLQSVQNLSDFTQELIRITQKIGPDNEEYGTTLSQFKVQYDEIRQLQAKLLSEYNELIDERQTHYERLKAYETEISELPYLRRENDRLRKQAEVLSDQLETAKTNLLGYSLCQQREEQLQAKVQSLQEQNEELRQQIQTLERIHSTAQDITHKLNLLSESQDNIKQLIIQLADKNTSVLERLLPSLITAGAVLFQNKKSDEIIQMLRQNLTTELSHSLASPDNQNEN